MFQKLLLLPIFAFTFLMANAQHNAQNIGSRSSAMAGAGVASTDFWSATNNQASLGYNKSYGAGFYYENSYLAKELSLNSMAIVVPTNKGSFVVDLNYFGYSEYNESKIGLGYGMALSERFAVGVQLDYLRTYIGGDYGSVNIFTFEVGIISKISKDITLGAHIFNPIQAKLNDYNNERISALMKLGLEWKLSEDFIALAEVQSDINNELAIIGGLEYRIKKILYSRIGVGTGPNMFSFGVGLNIKNFKLDFSSSMHQLLGYSPQVSLFYQFNK